jgi:hypothetical protein
VIVRLETPRALLVFVIFPIKNKSTICPLSYFLSMNKQRISHGSDKVLIAVKFRKKNTKSKGQKAAVMNLHAKQNVPLI